MLAVTGVSVALACVEASRLPRRTVVAALPATEVHSGGTTCTAKSVLLVRSRLLQLEKMSKLEAVAACECTDGATFDEAVACGPSCQIVIAVSRPCHGGARCTDETIGLAIQAGQSLIHRSKGSEVMPDCCMLGPDNPVLEGESRASSMPNHLYASTF
jgi:hypothetical protein